MRKSQISSIVFSHAASNGQIVLLGGEGGLYSYDGRLTLIDASGGVSNIDWGDGFWIYVRDGKLLKYENGVVASLGMDGELVKYNSESKRWLIVDGYDLWVYDGVGFQHALTVPFKVLTVTDVPASEVEYSPEVAAVTFDTNMGGDVSGTVLWVDGVGYSRSQLPVTFNWEVGSTHRFVWRDSVVSDGGGAVYLWEQTSGIAKLRMGKVTVIPGAHSIFASYGVEYLVTTVSSPSSGGTIQLSPESESGYYKAGTVVCATAHPNTGYLFIKWLANGLDYSTSNPTTITVDKKYVLTAVFAESAKVTFSVNGLGSDVSGIVLVVDGVGYAATSLPRSFTWAVGSTHSFTWNTPLSSTINGKRYIWASTSGLSSERIGSLIVPLEEAQFQLPIKRSTE